MPVTPTYPGVYIDELPSAVRTITGVPTSIAAFVGWTPRGPDDRPVHITSYADYERAFGGLHPRSPMSYAVHQFYLNGGSEAEIVRLAGEGAERSSVERGNGVKFEAASSGTAGDKIRVRIDHETKAPAKKYYNLTVRDTGTGAQESYLNICVDAALDPAGASRVDKVLGSSRLVTWAGDDPFALPKAHDAVEFGKDPFADPEEGKEPKTYSQLEGGKNGEPKLTPQSYFPVAEAEEGEEPKSAFEAKTGLYMLLDVDLFNMLCLPGLTDPDSFEGAPQGVLTEALKFCVDERAMLLVDPPQSWTDVSIAAEKQSSDQPYPEGAGDLGRNAAIYFPGVIAPDPLTGSTDVFPPCGVMAGLWARTDVQRGVWKAPAGTAASLSGVTGMAVPMTDLENGRLNPLGVNCLRSFPVIGPVSWGGRTLRGADRLADQWKYLPIRRLSLFIEESLFRGTQWVVFEPNDEPLWAQIRLNVGAFMNNLFRQGAFQGRTPQEAYLVKCDAENNPQNDIDLGIVNVLVGFAPLKPAEFVIIHIQQLAGQIQV
jgi:phage tail sheath protein FI